MKALRYGGVSALAIVAAMAVTSEADACTAFAVPSTTAPTSVAIVCNTGEPDVLPFTTAYTADTPFPSYNGAGPDTLTLNGGNIVNGAAGRPIVNGTPYDLDASVGNIEMGDGADRVSISGGFIGTSASPLALSLGAGADIFDLTGGFVSGSVFGLGGGNTYTVSGGAIGGAIFAGSQNDTVTISGTAGIGTEFGTDSVALEDGDDTFLMTGGTLAGSVSGGLGDDTITVRGGTIGSFVAGNEDDDVIEVSGGTILDDVNGNEGFDRVTVSGGTILGSIEGEEVILTGGTIGGDINGITGNTLIIDDSLSPATLNLRNGVVFNGIGANGFITNTDLARGGTFFQSFQGFQALNTNASTLGFAVNQAIAQLNLGNGSTLFVNGPVNLAGNLSSASSLISLVNGATTDVFTLGGLAIDASRIALDINPAASQADRIVATTFSAVNNNQILLNIVGAQQFANSTDTPVLFSTNGPVAGTFSAAALPGTLASLFTFQVLPGPGGGLIIRSIPTNVGVLAAPRNAVDSSTVENVFEAIYGITDDAIDNDLLLANGSNKVMISPSFGVFASGQLARTDHDGFEISSPSASIQGPSFNSNDFSAAISLDFNAAKHFQFDNQYGLNLGLFAGYASTDVDVDGFGGFGSVGSADNRSGMFGGYGLFRSGVNYGLVSFSSFLGNSDVENSILNSNGSYDTEGYAVTGSVGHIFALTDRVRFDLRGGMLGVTFRGDDYTDSSGVQYGSSRVRFGAVKFEPGIYADYVLESGKVFSPYLRADFQQRFGYRNRSSVAGTEVSFDDADFSAAASAGFNLKMSDRSTLNGEVRGKASSDSTTVGAKLGLKIAF